VVIANITTIKTYDMNYLTKIIYLFILTGTLISCQKEIYKEGQITCDLKLLQVDFDAVVINMKGYELLGDSIKVSDTIKSINGKFVYKYAVPEIRLIDFTLLKNKKSIGKLCLYNNKHIKGSKTSTLTYGNFFVGNEKITLTCDTINKKNYFGYTSYMVKSKDTKVNELYEEYNVFSGGKKITEDAIKENNDQYAILNQLFWQKEKFSNSKLNSMLDLFSDDLKQATSYKILKKYLDKKIDLEKNGYTTNFNWKDINGKGYKFKEVIKDKKYMLMVFWASWCGPCREEISNLKIFNSKFNNKVSLVSLSIDDNFKNWKSAVEKENMPWLNLSGLPNDKFGIKKEYNINAVPNLILLDQNGKVIINNINELSEINKYLESNE
jgi:thiol-disulfide isomerase/thioredoxin